MKTTILISITVLISFVTIAQTNDAPDEAPPKVIYLYDTAGNRIQRRVIYVGERLADTTLTEEQPPIDLPAGAITAYPNPTGGLLHVAVSPTLLEEGNAQYWLFDLSGRILRDGTITQSIITLDLSNEAKGVYILKVVAGTKKEEWQVVRQ